MQCHPFAFITHRRLAHKIRGAGSQQASQCEGENVIKAIFSFTSLLETARIHLKAICHFLASPPKLGFSDLASYSEVEMLVEAWLELGSNFFMRKEMCAALSWIGSEH